MNVFSLFSLFLIIAICNSYNLFPKNGEDNSGISNYPKTLTGSLDLRSCDDIQIDFALNIGTNFGEAWNVPLWIGETANGNPTKEFARFMFRKQGSNNWVRFDVRGVYDTVKLPDGLPLDQTKNHIIKLEILRSHKLYRLYMDGQHIKNTPNVNIPYPSDWQKIVIGPSWINGISGQRTGNHHVLSVHVRCKSTSTTSTTIIPVTPSPTFIRCPDDRVPLDIAFLIDESSSIEDNQFIEMNKFIKRLIEYDVNDASFISLIEFADTSKQILPFTSVAGNGRQNIINAVDVNKQSKGSTNTGSAIRNTLPLFDTNNVRPDLLFILTDGVATTPETVCPLDNSEDIEIVLIGIGAGLSVDILESDTFNCLYNNAVNDVFYFPNFNEEEFNEKEGELRAKTCRIEMNPNPNANAPQYGADIIEYDGYNNYYGGYQLVTNANGYYLYITLIGVIAVLIIVNIACCYINYINNKKNKGYKAVSYDTDTDA